MSINDFIKQLDTLVESAAEQFNSAIEKLDKDVLENARIEFLGAKSGKLKSAQKGLGKVDKEDKPT
ncbi:MAG: phenylalanine--tRNA ligase subunit alpha, partial [Pirellulales bacterium]